MRPSLLLWHITHRGLSKLGVYCYCTTAGKIADRQIKTCLQGACGTTNFSYRPAAILKLSHTVIGHQPSLSGKFTNRLAFENGLGIIAL